MCTSVVGKQNDVVVIGAGPNGLAAAVVAARAGLTVTVLEAQPTAGGGARTQDLGLAPGIEHDVCSAVHPLALASPFFREFDLAARGVELLVPQASFAHPLDDEPAALAWRDFERTCDDLGEPLTASQRSPVPTWRSTFAPLLASPDTVASLCLGTKRTLPASALSYDNAGTTMGFLRKLVRLGTSGLAHSLGSPRARALFAGVGAHTIAPLPSLAAAGTALLLATVAHTGGWPVPRGGSQAITDALCEDLRAHGGEIHTHTRITHARNLPPARAYLCDTTAPALARIFEDHLQPRTQRALRAFPHGAGAAKVDFVLSGPIPWRDPNVDQAATVHVGGTLPEISAAERAVSRGVLPPNPVVLVSDPTVVDHSRLSVHNGRQLRPVWTYAHVPANCTVDVTEHVTRQIERFAPGFRDLVVASRCIPACHMGEHNENYTGGDIATGIITPYRLFARPRPTWDPFTVGDIPVSKPPAARRSARIVLCSAATVPGPGVHGMSGYLAMTHTLRTVFGYPDLVPVSPHPRSP